MSALLAVTVAVLLRDFACPGCIVEAPENIEAPAALVVALHGDEGSPAKVVSVWAPVARELGFALFVPRCPRSEGCQGSWWRWDGSPKWLLERMDEIGRRFPVDERRRYLTGWSGGASYASLHVAELSGAFAAFSLAGGGIASESLACFVGAGSGCAPVHLLRGELNPHAALAERTRRYLEACGHEVHLVSLPATDHAGEWRRYSRDAKTIAAWLLSHPMSCPTPEPAGDGPAPSPSSAPPETRPVTRASPERPPVPPAGERVVVARGCACATAAGAGPWTETNRALFALALGGCLARRRRRPGGTSKRIAYAPTWRLSTCPSISKDASRLSLGAAVGSGER